MFGFAFFPEVLGTPSLGGDLWINRGNATQNLAEEGNTGFATYLHEIGHALGLSHPNDDPDNVANDPRNNNQWTVMSYIPHPTEAGVADPAADYPITPMVFDIQAMQAHYGANLDTRNGGTTYFGASVGGTATAYGLLPGEMLANGHHAILTLWDAGGTDWLNLANEVLPTTINLNPGTFSTVGVGANNIAMSAAVNVGGTVVNYIENVIGGSAIDRITGNAANNRLEGLGGNDQFFLNSGGNDQVIGGNGSDSANFGAAFTGVDRFYGGAGIDKLILNGDYLAGVVLTNTSLTDVESILLTTGFSYRLTLNNANIAATNTLTIDGSALGPTNQLILIGTPSETDGRMRALGGAGRDTLVGRGGLDRLLGGSENDVFRFDALSDSTLALPDLITDFATGDRIDLSRIDADTGTALDQAFHLGQGARTAGDIFLVYDAGHNRTRVDLYVDNNASIDARIFLAGNHSVMNN